MLAACTRGDGCCEGRCADCNTPIMYINVGVWTLIAVVGSVLWMAVVYQRYEVSVALPIEYGSLNAFSVILGLLFYDEYNFMTTPQLVGQIIGCALIFGGIGVGRLRF